MPKMLERAVKKGEGYQKGPPGLQQAVPGILADGPIRGQVPRRRVRPSRPRRRPACAGAVRHRRLPKQQREGMKLVAEHVFKTPELRSQAAQLPAGDALDCTGASSMPYRLDYPIYEYVATMQEMILFELLNPMTMERLHDNELKSRRRTRTATRWPSTCARWSIRLLRMERGQGGQVHRHDAVHSRLPPQPAADDHQGSGLPRAGAVQRSGRRPHAGPHAPADARFADQAIFEEEGRPARRLHAGPPARLAKADPPDPQRAGCSCRTWIDRFMNTRRTGIGLALVAAGSLAVLWLHGPPLGVPGEWAGAAFRSCRANGRC